MPTPTPQTPAPQLLIDGTDVNKPPPGISPLFWRTILNADPQRFANLTRPVFDSAGNRKAQQRDLFAFVQDAQKKWGQLEQKQRDDYAAADARGDRYDPYSLEGIKDRELREGKAKYDTAMAEHTQNIAEQRAKLQQLKQMSDPSMMAQEKLDLETDRRAADADYQGKVGATMRDMQARGMGGSGAELTRNLAGASEAANRHALDTLGARANAQKRAMEALGKATDLSTTMANTSGTAVTNAQTGITADEDSIFTLAGGKEQEGKINPPPK